MRKILKKHSKQTALPIPASISEEMITAVGSLRDASDSSSVKLFAVGSRALPRLLVQAIGEVLLPIIPLVDDHTCPICTSIAFKPIRLQCGHLFCVRCGTASFQNAEISDLRSAGAWSKCRNADKTIVPCTELNLC